MGEMDEKCPIGLEMFRTAMRCWPVGFVNSNQRNRRDHRLDCEDSGE